MSTSNRIIDFVILSLFISCVAASFPFVNSVTFILASLIFLIGVFVLRRRKFDLCLPIFIFIWSLINLISFIVNSPDSFPFRDFFVSVVRFTVAYFMLKDIGGPFFDELFDYLFVLVVISLPLFALQILFPMLFPSISSLFSNISPLEQANAGGFYSYIYTYSAWANTRNCGFMWEPGAYACFLIFMLFYHWLTNGFSLDTKCLVIIIALITTFSTAGYLSLFIALIAFVLISPTFSKAGKVVKYLSIIVVIAIGAVLYIKVPFMKNEIIDTASYGTDTWEWSFGNDSYTRVTRIGIASISLENSIHHPFGDGAIESSFILHKYGMVKGPSLLSLILRQWGWLGIVIIFILTYKFAKMYRATNLSAVLFVISLFIVWFSNPNSIMYMLVSIILYPILYHSRSRKSGISKGIASHEYLHCNNDERELDIIEN